MEINNEFKDFIEFSYQYAKENNELLLFNLNEINKYTASIDFNRIKENRFIFKKLLVDFVIREVFVNNGIINSFPRLTKLFPIKTLGDGNCLCHAVMLYLIGIQDHQNILRNTLKAYLNGTFSNELKERFIIHRKYLDQTLSIQSEDHILEAEWQEIKTMVRKINRKNDDHSRTSIYTQIYLEDIHIFAVANLLRRPIIVLALETLNDITPIGIRGVYLPLLNAPKDCIRQAIVIGFHNSHFVPLVFVKDTFNQAEETNGVIGDVFYDNEIFETPLNCTYIKPDRKRTYNYLPLVNKNSNGIESMKIQFLKQNEEKNVIKLLEDYLETAFVKTPDSGETNPIHIIAAKVFSQKYTSSNTIDMFIDYVNKIARKSPRLLRRLEYF